MTRVVLIETAADLDDRIEADMRRWWRHVCKKHVRNGEVYFEVGSRFNVNEGIKRLASFGVKARAANRPTGATP